MSTRDGKTAKEVAKKAEVMAVEASQLLLKRGIFEVNKTRWVGWTTPPEEVGSN